MVPVREPVIVPALEPVIVPVLEPVIVPTFELVAPLLDPVIVPAKEAVANERTSTPAVTMLRMRVMMVSPGDFHWDLADGED